MEDVAQSGARPLAQFVVGHVAARKFLHLVEERLPVLVGRIVDIAYIVEVLQDTRFHLCGGFVGERYRENMVGGIGVAAYQFADVFCRERESLSASR